MPSSGPTLLRQLAAFGAILLATAIRYQGLVLLLVLPTAIVLKVVFELCAAPRPRPVRFRLGLSYGATGSPAALLVGSGLLLRAAPGSHAGIDLASGLGGYRAVVGKRAIRSTHPGTGFCSTSPSSPFPWRCFPFPRSWCCSGLPSYAAGRGARRNGPSSLSPLRPFPWIVLEVAVFASRLLAAGRERYMFFLAPLLFLAFAVWLHRGLPRPPLFGAAAAAIPAALLFALPLGEPTEHLRSYSDTFGLIPLLRLSKLVPGGIPEVRHFLLAGGIGAAIVFTLWPRNALPRSSCRRPSRHSSSFRLLSDHLGTLHDYSLGPSSGLGRDARKREVGSTTGSAPEVKPPYLLGTTLETWPETLGLWQNEFWNRRLGRCTTSARPSRPVGSETLCGSEPDRVDRLDGDGQAVAARYVAV